MVDVDVTNKGYFIRKDTPVWLFFSEFCKVNQNSVSIQQLETTGNILKFQTFNRSLLNRNVHQFNFIFFKELS